MVKLLSDGRPCEIDDLENMSASDRATWVSLWVKSNGGWETGEVSDERLAELLAYFSSVEVDDGE